MNFAAEASGFQKFLFKGRAVALQGRVRKPYYQELGAHAVAATYAGSAGQSRSRNEGFALGTDISYGAAYSEVSTDEEDGRYKTSVRSTIENLKMLDGFLTVDKIVARLDSVYDRRLYPKRKEPRILPVECKIESLKVGRQEMKLDGRFAPAFYFGEDEREDFFSGKCDTDSRFYPGFIPDPLIVEGFGTLYFAEWAWVHPGEQCMQHLTMFRFALGSHFGADGGAASTTSDGKGWPPNG